MSTNEKIMEAAALLGQAIENDERREAYLAASKKYDEDENLGRMIEEYSHMRSVLNSLYSDGGTEKETTDAMEAHLNTLYLEITENEAYREFEAAKREIDIMLSSINAIIQKAITGQEPGGCSSCGGSCSDGCSSCGGCH